MTIILARVESSYWEDVKSIRKEAILKIKFHLSNVTNGNSLVYKNLFISFYTYVLK